MRSRNHLRGLTLLSAGALSLVLALSACGGAKPDRRDEDNAAPAAAASPAESTVEATATPDGEGGPAVAGYRPGEMPPIPEIVIPDFSLLNSSNGAFTIDTTKELATVPGIKVAPARCNGKGLVSSAGTILDGSGGGTQSSKGSRKVNDGHGGGTYTDKRVRVVITGDGSGTWDDSTAQRRIVLSGDGSGTYDDNEAGVRIVNTGDGSGTYDDGSLRIVNDGDGQALVTSGDGASVRIKADPVAKAPTVGSIPPMTAIKPVKSCGTTITLENGVLFDFGKSELRPEAKDTLGKVQKVFDKLKVPAAQVYGHTDSVDTEAFNQKLSEDRAAAVVTGLKDAGATATLESKGYGETKPVAPNTKKDGSDNPAGRQLNRRVEIFVPAF